MPNEAHLDLTLENGKKLDRVLFLLEGEPSAPGVLVKLQQHAETLYGISGNDGVVSKVNVMWRIHVWLLCSFSATFGLSWKNIFEKFFK